MEPVEAVEVIMDETDHVTEIRASQEWFDANPDWMPGIKRVAKEADMISLALPELEEK